MRTVLNRNGKRLINADVRAGLRSLEAESVQVCVTSPPYFGLRSYATEPQVWPVNGCAEHVWGEERSVTKGGEGQNKGLNNAAGYREARDTTSQTVKQGAFCVNGCWRGELGSEPTPALFVAHLVEVFREVRRVLRPDGVLFVNLGDSYSGSNGNGYQQTKDRANRTTGQPGNVDLRRLNGRDDTGIPPKSLLLVPERFAIAMQDDGWICRSRIAWVKTSCMPESVTDRPTSAWEHIWMFTKSARYFWDAEAVKQSASENTHSRGNGIGKKNAGISFGQGIKHNEDFASRINEVVPYANLRNAWILGPSPLKEAHFAVFVPEIPRRCILAATSERGQCSACGTPWRRVAEREGGNYPKRKARGVGGPYNLKPELYSPAGSMGGSATTTLGWQPSCRHYDDRYRSDYPQASSARKRHQRALSGDWWKRVRKRPGKAEWETTPQAILDPFAGSGTTLLVASQLGRRSIGIELNDEYTRLAERRLNQDSLFLAEVT